MAFFSSPGKVWLIKRLEHRNKRVVQKEQERPPAVTTGTGDVHLQGRLVGPGLPDDLEKEVTEAVQEIKEEVESRRNKGISISMPTGADMKAAVEEKIGKKLN